MSALLLGESRMGDDKELLISSNKPDRKTAYYLVLWFFCLRNEIIVFHEIHVLDSAICIVTKGVRS